MRDGSGWSASLYNQSARFVYSSEYTGAVLSLLDAQPGQRIIDFGCGSGELTLDIQEAVKHGDGGLVCGLDYSESMVRASAWGCNTASYHVLVRYAKQRRTGSNKHFR
jgi:ubiquinone/menaquinone biosynthesis C-methylase UbiE